MRTANGLLRFLEGVYQIYDEEPTHKLRQRLLALAKWEVKQFRPGYLRQLRGKASQASFGVQPLVSQAERGEIVRGSFGVILSIVRCYAATERQLAIESIQVLTP